MNRNSSENDRARLNQALNRVNPLPSSNRPDQDPQENMDGQEGEVQDTSTSTGDALTSLANKGLKAAIDGSKLMKNPWKLKVYLVLAGIVLFLLGILVLVSALKMFSIDNVFQYISDKASEVGETLSVGFEKTINLLSFKGWNTEDEAYNKAMEHEYRSFEKLNGYGPLDTALISATINYGRLINPSIWSDTTVDSGTLTEAEPTGNIGIGKENATNFYRWANVWVGNVDTLLPWNRGLSGALTSVKIENVCMEDPGFIASAGTVIESFGSYGINVLLGTAGDIITMNFISDIFGAYGHFSTTGNLLPVDGILSAYYQSVGIDPTNEELEQETYGYTRTSVYDTSGLSKAPCEDLLDEDGNVIQKRRMVAKVRVYNDYAKYRAYLKKFFIPRMYLDCSNCSLKDKKWGAGEKEKYIDSIINQIFAEKDSYNQMAGIELIDEFGNSVTIGSGFGSLTVYKPGEPSCPLDSVTTSSGYGPRVDPINGSSSFHTGQDIPKTTGTPIYSVGDGVVVSAGLNSIHWSYGISVKIGHDTNGDGAYDFYSLYAHMSVCNVATGQKIGGGQKIGEVGATGRVTGPHLHFEIRGADNAVMDPRPTLNAYCGGGAS